jgi:mannose-6-phosphate isomerase-like protein (cupin superfamily)
MKFSVAAAFVISFAAFGAAIAAQTGAKPRWTVHLNETRGPIRAADTKTPLGNESISEILAGPTSGSDAGYLIFTRIPNGAHGPALFTLPDEHLYLVLEGKMNIQIGTDTFVVDRNGGVMIPPNTPHEVWNAGPQAEAHLEVIAPGSSRDLTSMLKPAQPRKVENAAQYVRTPKIPTAAELKAGLNGVTFAERATGGTIQMRIDSTRPGQGGPKPHVHRFQQVYFSVEGQTTVEYGLDTYPLPKYSMAVIAPGVVHTNFNKTSAPERHVTLLMTEPENRNEPFDVEYERKGPVGTAATPVSGGDRR